ncbi:hypothetical protein O2N63_01980 [Aliiroseovarius sp. KMU-50]|uniref:Dynamin N-terminal domain-containing protein n=1 Tax=Aliiroseovarius salicola TaxID=3009082 RepID=A0ABT4VX75_9RHOB|nr:dynamin family protein [Aliiroseovarius sp. KMU-50]MDA5092850.1 hypothetical protein [Aliiroseovarius sp. KMU-50]
MIANLKSKKAALPRKPRIALMGEFSAGKSTLANLLMHEAFSQVQVTATQVPPVWFAQGEGPAVRIAMDGTEEPLDAEPDEEVTISNTRAIRKFVQADILEACDIIDMPGSSDPNITEDIWQSMLPLADAVIWCTPATQAWRQSEAAMWEDVPERLFRRSLILITRMDKVLSKEDQQRVVSRVQREAGSMFRAVIPVSLTVAQGAEDDPEAWNESGLNTVLAELQEIIEDFENVLTFDPQDNASELHAADSMEADYFAESGETEPLVQNRATPDADSPAFSRAVVSGSEKPPELEAVEDAPTDRVVPRRVAVRTGSSGRSRRPRRAASGSLI